MDKLVLIKVERINMRNTLEVFYAIFYATVMAYDRIIGGEPRYIEKEEKNNNHNIHTAHDGEADLVNIFTD